MIPIGLEAQSRHTNNYKHLAAYQSAELLPISESFLVG